MNLYFSGIGGVGISSLAHLAVDAGYTVHGSDSSQSEITNRLKNRGVEISFNQNEAFLMNCHQKQPIDWFIHTAALPDDHPELLLARKLGIKISKRDEFIKHIINANNLNLIAIAGTHGKTTTTGMTIWTLQQLQVPISYSIGTTISFGDSGKLDPRSNYFIYECDEFDRNFLNFFPELSIITSIGYDHPDSYPSRDDYKIAFQKFIKQSKKTIIWQDDIASLNISTASSILVANEVADLKLAGKHNRRNASLVIELAKTLMPNYLKRNQQINNVLKRFPGTDRRFEKLANNLYSDYGHTPDEIAATLQMAKELSDRVILVYQPHQNIRQHDIKNQYTDEVFKNADEVHWLPTYLTRENPELDILTPKQLTSQLKTTKVHLCRLDNQLKQSIKDYTKTGALVLCMGAGSIDKWLRRQLT